MLTQSSAPVAVEQAPPPHLGTRVALFRAKGGQGATSVAVNLAVVLSERRRNRVLLIDADLQFGGIATALDLNENGVGPALKTVPSSLMWEDRGGLGLLWVAAAVLAPLLCRGRVRFQEVHQEPQLSEHPLRVSIASDGTKNETAPPTPTQAPARTNGL